MTAKPLVSVVRCGHYEPAAVRAAVAEALRPWGGMRYFVRPGMHVLLKPNLLKAAHPSQGISTHPTEVESGLVTRLPGVVTRSTTCCARPARCVRRRGRALR
jgi:uncharacterized protein (DUF362 family)